jgi:site-specific DNA-methyltransferase (adenine-specific)
MTGITPYYRDERADITLYCAPYSEVLSTLAPRSIDVVLTDVPYNLSQKSGGLRKLDYGAWDHGFDLETALGEMIRVCRGSLYVWCSNNQLSVVLNRYRTEGLPEATLLWLKPNPSVLNGDKLWLETMEACAFGKRPGAPFYEHCRAGVWQLPPDRERLHPNQKPLKIITQQLLASSSPGDRVLDPFVGSGTTLRAAKNTGRRAIGCDSDEACCAVTARRLAQEAMAFP